MSQKLAGNVSHPLLLSLLLIVGLPMGAIAHGISLQYQTLLEADASATAPAIRLKATFDSDQPVVNAQILVYEPGVPDPPWLSGQTDASGAFIFTPDSSKPGNWEVKLRQAGHGQTITIVVDEALPAAANPEHPVPATQPITSETPSAMNLLRMNKQVVGIAVVSGLMGTALFFSWRKR